MKRFYERNSRAVNQILVFAIALIVIGVFFKFLFGVLAPFILAFLLSLIISSPVNLLTRNTRIPRGIATIFSMLVILSALVLLLNLILRMIFSQIISFSANFPVTFNNVIELSKSFQSKYYDFFEIMPEDMGVYVEQTIIGAIPSLAASVGNVVSSFSLAAVKAVPNVIVFIVITLVATFFMTKDQQMVLGFFSRQLPDSVKDTALILKKDIFGALWGYIRAQLTLMCFSGLIAITGLTVLRYEYALLIGLVIAVFDALPIFGAGFVLWPWAAFRFLSGDYRFGFALLVIYITITICRQMLEPKVLSAQIGLYPLITLAAIYLGLMLLGPIGLIAGPVLAIVVKSLQKADLLPGWK